MDSDSASSDSHFDQDRERSSQVRYKDLNQGLLDKLTQEKLDSKTKNSKPNDLSSGMPFHRFCYSLQISLNKLNISCRTMRTVLFYSVHYILQPEKHLPQQYNKKTDFTPFLFNLNIMCPYNLNILCVLISFYSVTH